MKFPRRHGHKLTLAVGGTALVASLFFAAQMIKAPVYTDLGSVASVSESSASLRNPYREPMLPPGESGVFVSDPSKPAVDAPPAIDLALEPLPPMQFPVGNDSVPQASGAISFSAIEFPWAFGRNEDRWEPQIGPSGGSYTLAYPLTPPGPADLRQYGGDPNAPQSSARRYQMDNPNDGQTVTIPEPGVFALLGVGFLLLGIRRAGR